jgi:uncharacterized protein (DUF302 family)
MRKSVCGLLSSLVVVAAVSTAQAGENGLITKPSSHSVRETVDRFSQAVTSKGWMVFTEIDHAAAAEKQGLQLRPRTVIVFGNPKAGSGPMAKAATLAIDLPLKALVWQDDEGRTWLTYNSSDYLGEHINPRHGLPSPPEARAALEKALSDFSGAATK